MKRICAALIALALFANAPASAQQNQPLFATGALTPGHALVLQQAGTPGSAVTRDAGPALAGNFTELGITNDGLPFCVRDKAQQHLLCLGANALGGGLISFNPIGGAPATGFQINLNGTNYPFPPTGGGTGNVVGPSSSTVGQIAFFNNTTGTLLTGVSSGPALIGTDQFAGIFGSGNLLVGNATSANAIIGQVTNNSAPNTAVLPSGTLGAGKLTSNGNQVFGLYGRAECRQTLGGVCIGGELTAGNYTSNNPDTSLPPATGIGTSTTVVTGQNMTCAVTGGATHDCSLGIYVTNETGNYANPVFNTGMFIGLFRQYGLYIDAMPSGIQTSAVIRNNGNGLNLLLQTSQTMVAANSALEVADTTGVAHALIKQNGDTFANTLAWVGHYNPPTLGACGTGGSIVNFATDARGIVNVGTGTTSCVINFGAPFTQLPVIVVSGENAVNISVTAKGLSSFTVGGTSIAGTNFDYVVMSQGSL